MIEGLRWLLLAIMGEENEAVTGGRKGVMLRGPLFTRFSITVVTI